MKLSLKIAISILFIVSILILLVPFLFDWNSYKPQIKEKLFEITGLNIQINGDIDVQIFPFPRLSIENIALQNPEWEEIKDVNKTYQNIDQKQFFKAERINITAAYMPLLSGQVIFDEIQIIAPQLQVIKDKKGDYNWQSAKIKGVSTAGSSASQAKDAGSEEQVSDKDEVIGIASQQSDERSVSSWQDKVAIREINIQNASMQIINEQSGREQVLKNANLSVTGELSSLTNIGDVQNASYEFTSQLDYSGYHFNLNGDVGLKDWQNKIISLQLNSSVSSLDSDGLSVVNKDFFVGKFSGIVDFMKQAELQGDFDIKLASLGDLMSLTQPNKTQLASASLNQVMQNASLRGQLAASQGGVNIPSLKLLLDDHLILKSQVNISNILSPDLSENNVKITVNSEIESGLDLSNFVRKARLVTRKDADEGILTPQKPRANVNSRREVSAIHAMLHKEQDFVFVLNNLSYLSNLKEFIDIDLQVYAPQVKYQGNQINDLNLSFKINDNKLSSFIKFTDIKSGDVGLAGLGNLGLRYPVQKDAVKGLLVDYKLDYRSSMDKASCTQYKKHQEAAGEGISVGRFLCELSLLRSSGDVFVANDRMKADGLTIQLDQYKLDSNFAYHINGIKGQIGSKNLAKDERKLSRISSDLNLVGKFIVDNKYKDKQHLNNNSLSEILGKISGASYNISIKNPSIFNPVSYDVAIDVSMHNARLENQGRIVFDGQNAKLPFGFGYKQGKIRLKSSDLSIIAQEMAGLNYNLAGKTNLSADISLDDKGQGIVFDRIDGHLADIPLSGHVKTHGIFPQNRESKSAAKRPSYDFALKAGKVDLDRYMPSAKSRQSSTAKLSNAGENRLVNGQNNLSGVAGGGVSQQGLDTRFLREFDAKFDFDVQEIILNGISGHDLVLLADVKDGRLKVSTATFNALDGRVNAGLVVEGQSKLQDPVRIAGNLGVNNMQLRQFVPVLTQFGVLGTPFVQGDASFDIDFKAIGVSPAALLYGLNGTGKLSGQDVVFNGVDIRGVIEAIEDADNIGQGLALINQSIGKGGTIFKSLDMPFDIKKGVVIIGEDAALLRKDASLLFEGSVNLPDSNINILSNIVFRNENIPSIQIKTTGPIQDPKNSFSSNVLEEYLKNKLSRKLDDILRDKLGEKIPLNAVENLFRAFGGGGSQQPQDGSR